MMEFLNDVWFDLFLFLKTLPVFAIKIMILYFAVKFAVKNALNEHGNFLKKEEDKKQ